MSPGRHLRRAGRWIEGAGICLLVLGLPGILVPAVALAVKWRDAPPESISAAVIVAACSALAAFGGLQLIALGAGAVAVAEIHDHARRQTRHLRAIRRALAPRPLSSPADRLRGGS